MRENPEAKCRRDGPPPPYAITHRCQRLSSQRGPQPEENSGLFPSPEGREEKRVWGPKKEAEAAPPALGKEATLRLHPRGGQRSERRDLCLCLLLSFSIFAKEWVGDFQRARLGARWRLVPSPGYQESWLGCCPSQGGHLGTHPWGLVTSHAASPFFCLSGQKHIVSGPPRAYFRLNHPARPVLTFHFPEWETEAETG